VARSQEEGILALSDTIWISAWALDPSNSLMNSSRDLVVVVVATFRDYGRPVCEIRL
jgi:hypothetical protein